MEGFLSIFGCGTGIRTPINPDFIGTVPEVISRKAGAVGFEPTNGGFKGPCLTTWRRPSFTKKLVFNDVQFY